MRAHRVAFALANPGQLTFDLVVRHRCDNPPCCNPAHLCLGTHADNVADKVERQRQARGEGAAKAKLTKAQAEAILLDPRSCRAITDEQKVKLRELILGRVPIRRAALICGIGACSAYRIRDTIKAELGDAFPSPRLPGRVSKLRAEMLLAQAIAPEHLWRFRALVREHGEEEARRLLRAEVATARRAETFEQKLARADLKIVAAFKPTKQYDFTIGGIATGQIA